MTRSPQTFRRTSSRAHLANRRGVVLAAALVEFVVATAILFSVLQNVVGHHRRMFMGQQQLQTQWLVQAGLDRAVAQLRQSANYRGETWLVPADQLDGSAPAKIQITLDPLPDHADQLQLSVQTNYPSDSLNSVQLTRTATVHLK